MARVEIYSKSFCPYCVRARQLLDSRQIEYREYSIDFEAGKREEMIQRASGRTTVPQIFVGGRHIGGCSDLLALDSDGKLSALLDA